MVHPYLSALITHTGITYPSSGLVLAQLGVVEPKSNLFGSGIERVGSVDQVSAGLLAFLMYAGKAGRDEKRGKGEDVPDRDRILTPNRSGIRFLRVGSSHDPSLYISPIPLDSRRGDVHPA